MLLSLVDSMHLTFLCSKWSNIRLKVPCIDFNISEIPKYSYLWYIVFGYIWFNYLQNSNLFFLNFISALLLYLITFWWKSTKLFGLKCMHDPNHIPSTQIICTIHQSAVGFFFFFFFPCSTSGQKFLTKTCTFNSMDFKSFWV